MGLSENSDDHIYTKHKEICKDLNMDSNTTNVAWESYASIKQNYNLEGDQTHWLGCSIYVAGRKAETPTVGQSGSYVRGNYVSLTRLLRLCGLSLMQFFNKCKNWCNMASMPPELRMKIDSLERNFRVSLVIFKKYLTIYNEMLQNPVEETPKQIRSRKPRNAPCTPNRVFEFCWTLFVYIKGEFTECSADLVTSFHLLLACCDMAFNNALMADRRDLLNKDFPALPSNFNSPDYVKPTAPVCIIDILCQQFDGVVKEAKWVKEYSWKPALTRLFNKGILHGDENNFTGLFDPSNFDNNFKAINKKYEEHVLNIGEFDEKIFLAECRRLQLIVKQAASNGNMRSPMNDIHSDNNLNSALLGDNDRNSLEHFDNRTNQLIPQTPLTGRYLNGTEQNRFQPLTAATQCVIRLQTMLANRQPEPSEELLAILKSFSIDQTESIKKRVDDMSDLFRTEYTKATPDQSSVSADLANYRIVLSKTLYYKLLENIFFDEKDKNPNLDLSTLTQNDMFHQVLFACSIEIVIFSYNSQRKFPWILKALKIPAVSFYKVIELIIRTKDQLSRDVIKHLKTIEEQILDSLAWTSDSPLWDSIANLNESVPAYEDTCLPGQTEDGQQQILNPNIRRIQTPTSSNGQQSPVYSATERFQSPIPTNSIVKKKLFLESSAKIKPGQSLLQNKVLVVVDDEGNQKIVPINEISVQSPAPSQQVKATSTPPKPNRTGSLPLFFRKFYSLVALRMRNLCEHLRITDTSLMQKIFTCFEHSIVENTDLMKDRHLDQILMCAIYVICKVSRNEKSFTDIMCCYRYQPQADSHIYRSVLISKHNSNDQQAVNKTVEPQNAPVNPSECAGTLTNHDQESRGDLILFYNQVYVPREQQFVNRFAASNQAENLHLSPLPVARPMLQASPKRRVTDNVFVRPFDHTNSQSNAKQYSYLFSRSPSKDLQNINQVINARVGKRLLADEDDEDITPLKKSMSNMSRKLQGLIEERLGHAKE